MNIVLFGKNDVCPKCKQQRKHNAKKCRYCSYEFRRNDKGDVIE